MFLIQRTEKPKFLKFVPIPICDLLYERCRIHAYSISYSVFSHQQPPFSISVYEPSLPRPLPGNAVKPLLFVAPVFGLFQCNVSISFNLPPMSVPNQPIIFVSTVLSKNSSNIFHSILLDVCHPVGQIFLESF